MVILRLSVITIFMLFGTYKWFDFEVMALEPIISSTWLNILYILFGVHGELLPRRNGNAYLSGTDYRFLQTCCRRAGDIIVIVTGITTLSLLPQLGKIDSFIIKDVLLIGAGAVLLKHDLKRYLTIRA